MVVEAGETVTLAPVKAPGFHVYVEPPNADNEAVCPAQIDDVPEAVIVGNGTTVTVTVPFEEQVPLEAVTVYGVVEPGLTDAVAEVIAPGFHVYVEPPEATKETVLPTQIEGVEGLMVTTGTGATVGLIVYVDRHPPPFTAVTE